MAGYDARREPPVLALALANLHRWNTKSQIQIVGRLFKEQVIATDAVDRRCPDFTTRRDGHRLLRY
jgi:hypothetical protein